MGPDRSLSSRRRAMFRRTAITSSAASFIASSPWSLKSRSRSSLPIFSSVVLAMMCHCLSSSVARFRSDGLARLSSTACRTMSIPSNSRFHQVNRWTRSERLPLHRKRTCPYPPPATVVSRPGRSWLLPSVAQIPAENVSDR